MRLLGVGLNPQTTRSTCSSSRAAPASFRAESQNIAYRAGDRTDVWVCTASVHTQSRELVLGPSLSEFMGKLGMAPVGGGPTGTRTQLRNQMRRLFKAQSPMNKGS